METHAEGMALPVFERVLVFGGQLMHAACPGTFWYELTAQREHVLVAVEAAKEPALQLVHDVRAVAPLVLMPAGHAVCDDDPLVGTK